MTGRPKDSHSSACASARGKGYCDCETPLRTRLVKVWCVCGNQWKEPGVRDHGLSECACAFPGDEIELDDDDSLDRNSREHRYNVDRLQRGGIR